MTNKILLQPKKRNLLSYFQMTLYVVVTLVSFPPYGFSESTPASTPPIVRTPLDKHSTDYVLSDEVKISRVVIKFQEGSGVRLDSEELVAKNIDKAELAYSAPQMSVFQLSQELGSINTNLPMYGLTVQPLFKVAEETLKTLKESGEQQSGRQLADLNLYYEIPLTEGTNYSDVSDTLAFFNSLASVEIAYAEPIAELTVLPPTPEPTIPLKIPTPDFESMQGYLNDPPSGIGARKCAWPVTGGRGDGVKVVDVEGAWNTTHEDMPPMFYTNGTQIPDIGWRNHGTAVLGEIAGVKNGFGVTGIASDAKVGYASIGSQSVASAITNAALGAGKGGIVLIELHAQGPANSSPCTCNTPQCDYIAMEYWQAEFDAIAAATASGVIVVEAAGNGSSNLDDSVYGGRFNRKVRDSGAILVAASESNAGIPTCWTNWGSRIDVHGWGYNVVTLGYGDLHNGGSENSYYTAQFSGTSSASPIIVGATASVQGVAMALGKPMQPLEIRKLLTDTGTPQEGNLSKQIGPLPNLCKAITPPPPPSDSCLGITCTIKSTPGVITQGTNGDDVICGSEGNDIILGKDGHDTICGKAGDDIILAGNGHDRIDAGPGDDIVDGGTGIDMLEGGSEDDTLLGGNDMDLLYGGTGYDYLSGGNGRDMLNGGADKDVCEKESTTGQLVGCESVVPLTQMNIYTLDSNLIPPELSNSLNILKLETGSIQ